MALFKKIGALLKRSLRHVLALGRGWAPVEADQLFNDAEQELRA